MALDAMRFRGSISSKRYFEGWYFKQVTSDIRSAFAFIPGISISPEGSHAFVQFIDGRTGTTRYFSFPISDFHTDSTQFHVQVGCSQFSNQGIKVKLDDDHGTIDANLTFSEITPLNKHILGASIMGPFAFAPFMECYHGIGSLKHRVSGEIRIAGERFDMDKGIGYLEKDWGRSMPSAWIWAQSNNFSNSNASLIVSLACVPWMGSWFPGFFCVLMIGGMQYRFASYTGASVSRVSFSGRDLDVNIRDGKRSLSIRAHRSHEGILMAPLGGAMNRRIGESIDAALYIRMEKQDGTLLFEDSARCAGLEMVGDLARLALKASKINPV